MAHSPLCKPRLLSLLTLVGIVALSLFYARPLLDLNPDRILAVREAEWVIEGDLLAWRSVVEHRELPLWNPYWYTGRPLLADPFFHALDPKMLLPIALLGVMNGVKIGIALSVVAMGLGGWWLGGAMGLGTVARGWLGAASAVSGHLIGYYSGVGSIGLGLSLAYVPWVLAAALALRERPTARGAALLAISGTLLYWASNTHYAYYTVLALGILALAELSWGYLTSAWRGVTRYLAHAALAGVLAAGLSAVILLPQLELSAYLFKPLIDDAIRPVGQPVEGLMLNFIVSDPAYYGSELFNLNRFMIGHYSYISWLPLGLLGALPLAWRRGARRPISWMGIILALALLYAAGNHTPFWPLFRALPGGAWLRFPERMLGLATIALLALAALGLDALWHALRERVARPALSAIERRRAMALGGLLGLYALVALALPYRANGRHLRLVERDRRAELAVQALRARMGERAYHLFVSTDFSLLATSGAGVGQINAPLTWLLDRPPPLPDLVELMHRASEAAILVEERPVPEQFGAWDYLDRVAGYDLYRLPMGMPYAFTAPPSLDPWAALDPDAPRAPHPATRPSPRRIELTVDSPGGERLVVAESHYPGWRASVDESPLEIEPWGGFLSVRTRPGVHTYRFHFAPRLPLVGLALTLGTIPLLALLLLGNREGATLFGTRVERVLNRLTVPD